MPIVNDTILGIDPYDLYLSFQSTVNTFIGGWFRPNTDFITKANDISNAMWVKWTDMAEKSQEARDNLIFFLKSKNRMVTKQNSFYGTFQPPADYGRYASAKMLIGPDDKTVPSKDVDKGKCQGYKTDQQLANDYYENAKEIGITNIDNQRWSSFIQHPTKGPTMAKPGITQINGIFHVSPRDVSVVVLNYYVKPINAVFAYDITPGNLKTGAGDQIIYNKSNSTALPWPNTIRNEFLIGLGESYSYFTREQFWAQFNNQEKKTA